MVLTYGGGHSGLPWWIRPRDRVFKEESLWLEAEAWSHTRNAYGQQHCRRRGPHRSRWGRLSQAFTVLRAGMTGGRKRPPVVVVFPRVRIPAACRDETRRLLPRSILCRPDSALSLSMRTDLPLRRQTAESLKVRVRTRSLVTHTELAEDDYLALSLTYLSLSVAQPFTQGGWRAARHLRRRPMKRRLRRQTNGLMAAETTGVGPKRCKRPTFHHCR